MLISCEQSSISFKNWRLRWLWHNFGLENGLGRAHALEHIRIFTLNKGKILEKPCFLQADLFCQEWRIFPFLLVTGGWFDCNKKKFGFLCLLIQKWKNTCCEISQKRIFATFIACFPYKTTANLHFLWKLSNRQELQRPLGCPFVSRNVTLQIFFLLYFTF